MLKEEYFSTKTGKWDFFISKVQVALQGLKAVNICLVQVSLQVPSPRDLYIMSLNVTGQNHQFDASWQADKKFEKVC